VDLGQGLLLLQEGCPVSGQVGLLCFNQTEGSDLRRIKWEGGERGRGKGGEKVEEKKGEETVNKP
jgi:hypothetical protein